MSLLTEWQARIPTPRQIQFTNPDITTAGGVNMTVLNNAIADTKAEFQAITGVALDDVTPNPQHIAAGVAGVTAYLASYGASSVEYADKLLQPFRARCARLTVLLSRTSSVFTPSTPDTSGGPVRPDFDPEIMGDIIPNQPGGPRQIPAPRFN